MIDICWDDLLDESNPWLSIAHFHSVWNTDMFFLLLACNFLRCLVSDSQEGFQPTKVKDVMPLEVLNTSELGLVEGTGFEADLIHVPIASSHWKYVPAAQGAWRMERIKAVSVWSCIEVTDVVGLDR